MLRCSFTNCTSALSRCGCFRCGCSFTSRFFFSHCPNSPVLVFVHRWFALRLRHVSRHATLLVRALLLEHLIFDELFAHPRADPRSSRGPLVFTCCAWSAGCVASLHSLPALTYHDAPLFVGEVLLRRGLLRHYSRSLSLRARAHSSTSVFRVCPTEVCSRHCLDWCQVVSPALSSHTPTLIDRSASGGAILCSSVPHAAQQKARLAPWSLCLCFRFTALSQLFTWHFRGLTSCAHLPTRSKLAFSFGTLYL